MRHIVSYLIQQYDRWRADLRRTKVRSMAAMVAVLLVHLGLFTLLAQWRSPSLSTQAEGVAVSLITGIGRNPLSNAVLPVPALVKPLPREVAPPLVADKPDPPKIEAPAPNLKMPLVMKLRDDLEPIPIDKATPLSPPPLAVPASQPAVDLAAAAVNGRKRCEIFDVVQAALQTSQTVQAAIAVIPAKSRSVANAVMIWDGNWAAADSMGGPAALEPIQKAVLDGVTQAPPACQDDLVRGPRLIIVGGPRNATVLAFGSGDWRWSDLSKTAFGPNLLTMPSK